MTNYDFSSNEIGEMNEQVILNRTAFFPLDVPIYISVYAYTSSVYSPSYDAILETA
jgi:hypothetical protein